MTSLEAFPIAQEIQQQAKLDLESREEITRYLKRITQPQGKQVAKIVKTWGFDWIRFRRAVDSFQAGPELAEFAYRCAEIWEKGKGFVPLDFKLKEELSAPAV